MIESRDASRYYLKSVSGDAFSQVTGTSEALLLNPSDEEVANREVTILDNSGRAHSTNSNDELLLDTNLIRKSKTYGPLQNDFSCPLPLVRNVKVCREDKHEANDQDVRADGHPHGGHVSRCFLLPHDIC